jgi:hypothetical protein
MSKTKAKPAAKRRSKTQAMRNVAKPIVIPAAPWTQRLELAPGVVLYQGDCVAVMAALERESVHAVVTDPPYELGFMGKAWDAAGGVASRPETWARAFDALKPGGHLVAFAGSRTYHRIACAIEDAGFDIRDQLMWLYGSGFPKSHDVAKCIDKAGGYGGVEPARRSRPTRGARSASTSRGRQKGRPSSTTPAPGTAGALPSSRRTSRSHWRASRSLAR